MDILLCDESIESLKILSFIIEQKNLGEVVDEIYDGFGALDSILLLNPDLVITEYKLSGLDGNEVIRRARNKGYQGKIIVVSSVTDPEVISKAYENGANIFIRKPINIGEMIHIISDQLNYQAMERIVMKMRGLLVNETMQQTVSGNKEYITLETEIERVLISLGLHGQSGFDELKELVMVYSDEDYPDGENLSIFYEKLSRRFDEKNKTIEQKIRRIVAKAFDYVALKGIEDYDSLVFDRYAALLFDFTDLRNHMNFLRGKSKTKGKLQIRKFIEGIKIIASENLEG